MITAAFSGGLYLGYAERALLRAGSSERGSLAGRRSISFIDFRVLARRRGPRPGGGSASPPGGAPFDTAILRADMCARRLFSGIYPEISRSQGVFFAAGIDFQALNVLPTVYRDRRPSTHRRGIIRVASRLENFVHMFVC